MSYSRFLEYLDMGRVKKVGVCGSNMLLHIISLQLHAKAGVFVALLVVVQWAQLGRFDHQDSVADAQAGLVPRDTHFRTTCLLLVLLYV